MQYFFLGFITLHLFMQTGYSQKTVPVSWTFDITKVSTNLYEIKAKATMQPSWVIYSQFTEDGGPIPTFFMVNGQPVKMVEESKVIKEFDELFEVNVMKFKDVAIFTTKIEHSSGQNIVGSVEYMTCDGARCLPPVEVPFNISYNK